MSDDYVTLKCPHCGSDEGIRCVDKVITTNDVSGWRLIKGQLHPDYSDSGSAVHWDSCEPKVSKFPFECKACDKMISEKMLIDRFAELSAPDDEDEDEEGDDDGE